MSIYKKILVMLSLTMTISIGQLAPANAEEKKTITDIEVIDQDGKKVKIYSDLMKGKIVGVNFIYTTCKMICIPMSAVFSGAARTLNEEGSVDKYSLISVTLDPENDTPEKLKEFAKKHKQSKGWTLVTGDPVKVRALLKELGGFEKNIESHGAFTVIGNDKTGEWKKISGIKPPKTLIEELKKLEIKEVSQKEADRTYFTDTIVLDQSGRKHRFYSDLLKDRIALINFGFTSCNGACPIAVKNLKEAVSSLSSSLKKEEFQNLVVLWVSVDKRDDLKKLASFYKKMGISSDRFHLITGDSSAMEDLIQRFGQKVNSPDDHSNTVFVGNLKTGVWNKVVSIRGSSEIIQAVMSVI
jgi:protein SCO1/2